MRERVNTIVTSEGRRDARVNTEVTLEGRRDARINTEVTLEGRRDARVNTEVTLEGRRDAQVNTEAALAENEKRVQLLDEIYENISRVANVDTLNKILQKVNSAPITGNFSEKAIKRKKLISVTGKEYWILRKLSEGGESVIFLCECQGTKVAAKLFDGAENVGTHSLETREKVFEFMNSPDGKDCVVPVMDFGLVDVVGGYLNYFEIIPFYAEGDMENTPITDFNELKKIIKELNYSIHKIHQKGILHLDIKPANIYRQNGKILLGDFGTAKTKKNTATKTSVGTDGFRAPETLYATLGGKDARYIYTEACDYYSLGVTIASFYEGKNYFDGLEADIVPKRVQESNLSLSIGKLHSSYEEVSQLQSLVNNLCQYDRNNRFRYEDVCIWLENPNYKGNLDKSKNRDDSVWIREFYVEIDGKEYRLNTPEKLFELLTDNGSCWKEGVRNLYEGYFEAFFKEIDQKLAKNASRLRKTYVKTNPHLGFFYFLKILYPAGPIVWRGGKWRTIEGLSENIFQCINSERSNLQGYVSLLKNRIISYWIENTEGCEADLQTIEQIKKIEDFSEKFPEVACYWFGYMFAADLKNPIYSSWRIGNERVNGIKEVFEKSFCTPRKFYAEGGIYDTLIKWDTGEGAKIYAWLCLMGFYSQIEEVFVNREENEFSHFIKVFMFWGALGEKMGMQMDNFNNFFLNYGPLASVKYICEIQQKEHIYSSVNECAKGVLTAIENVSLPQNCSYKESYNKLKHIFGIQDELRKVLYNNPYLVQEGMIENDSGKSIICNNLKGYFGYSFLGESAPLGLMQILNQDT